MRLTLVGTGITLPHVDETALRYNLAIAHLEAYVRGEADLAHVDVSRLDEQYSLDDPTDVNESVARVLATRPDVLGLSCYSWDIAFLLAVAARVRAARPAVRVVLGGPSASYQARELLATHPAVDAVVRGEGELTLAELLRSDWRDLSGVLGVSWRAPDGAIHAEPDRPTVPDLARLRSPLLGGALVPPRQNLLFEFARGCVYRCKYCAWKLGGGGVRYVPEQRVRDELAWARERGYEHAFLIDSAINNHDERLAVVSRAVRDLDPHGELALSYFVNAAFVTPAQVRLLAPIHAHEINVGLETTNPAALQAAGRRAFDEAAYERALDELAELGPSTLHLMLGMPGDDLAGFRRSLDFAARQAERPGRPRVRAVRVHWMIVPPGSELWSDVGRHGVHVQREGVPYVTSTDAFPRDDLVAALHAIHDHPRADLFVWEDAEPLKMLDGVALPPMFRAGGDHLGGRAPRQIGDDEVLSAIHPLAPGRPLRRGWRVGPFERRHGWPVIALEGPDDQRLLLQLRPREAEPTPYRRTASFDLTWLPGEGGADESREGPKLVAALADLVARNDAREEV